MRAAIVFVCSLLIHLSSSAQNNCPAGQGTLDGSPCIPSKMVAFLQCVKSTGNGRVEISKKTSDSKSSSLEVDASGSGSGVIIKAGGSATFKKSDTDQAINDVTEKINPAIAGYCKEIALYSESLVPAGAGEGATQSPPAPTAPKPPRYNGSMGPLEPGISYNQGDIYDSPSQTAPQCSNLCRDDDRCVAVTWIASQKRCWVKGSFTGNMGKTGDMTSARKLITK